MRTFTFTRFVPTFGWTFSLLLGVGILFLSVMLPSRSEAIDSEKVPKISCPTTWKQNGDSPSWKAESICSFGKVETTFRESKDLYLLSIKGVPKELSCYEVKYSSGSSTGCEISK